jgi:hypothetical protein
MEWKGLSKSVNAERSKGYHVASAKMMTNVYGRCVYGIEERPQARKVCSRVRAIKLFSLRSAGSRVA